MSLVKAIHSEILGLKLDPSEDRAKHHFFQCGIHSAAAAVSRFKEQEDNILEALKELTQITEEVESEKATQEEWPDLIKRVRAAIGKVNEAFGIVPKKQPPIIQDLTAEEVLNLNAFSNDSTLRDVFNGLWTEDADVDKHHEEFANTILTSLKAAGYVRIVKDA